MHRLDNQWERLPVVIKNGHIFKEYNGHRVYTQQRNHYGEGIWRVETPDGRLTDVHHYTPCSALHDIDLRVDNE